MFKKKKKEAKKEVAKKPTSKPSPADHQKVYERGMATIRDFIAPAALKFSPSYIEVGSVLSRTVFVITYPKYLNSGWFSPIINVDFSMDIAMFIHPLNSADVIKNLRNTTARVTSQIMLEQRSGKVRDPVLENALINAEELRERLIQGTESFFRFGLYLTIYASNAKELDQITNRLQAMLESQMVYTKPAVMRMHQGFFSTLPIANDEIDMGNNLNTSPLSTTFPFVSSDLSSNEGILYGINRHNSSLILFDRFQMENANMVIFAKSGAGKSYAVKLEILRSMMFGTDVFVIDPENEYKHLCDTMGGSFIPISLNSEYRINPFDLPTVNESDNPTNVFRSHIASLIGLLHVMLGAVTPEEDAMLDRAIRETYAVRDISPDTAFNLLPQEAIPTMSDLYAVLSSMEGAESLSARLEKYTSGIFEGFVNHKTNVETRNQMVVFNIRDLEEELRPVAMYIVLQFIWNMMRSELKRRLLIVDEAWIMMRNDDAASFMFAIAKRCRKYYTGLTTITQDISDFMASRYGKPIVTNSSLQLLLRQSPASIDIVAETFYLTEQEKFLLLESSVGEGIFFAGPKHVAIRIIASYNEDQIITSDPRQLLEIEEAKRKFDEENR